MLTIVYDMIGETVSDFEAEAWVENKIEEYKNNDFEDMNIYISNELTLLYFVLQTMNENIGFHDITIYYDGVECKVSRYSGLEFCNEKDIVEGNFSKINYDILKIAYKNVKERKAE